MSVQRPLSDAELRRAIKLCLALALLVALLWIVLAFSGCKELKWINPTACPVCPGQDLIITASGLGAITDSGARDQAFGVAASGDVVVHVTADVILVPGWLSPWVIDRVGCCEEGHER